MGDFVFNLAGLIRSPSGSERIFGVEAPPVVLDILELMDPVIGKVRLIRLPDAVHVAGEFATRVEQPCARCLEPALESLAFSVDEQYVAALDLLTGEPMPSSDDRPRLDDHHNLDLSVLLAEGVISALSLMPLCQPDCPGMSDDSLTGEEGANSDFPDPRLEPLIRLRGQMFPKPRSVE